MTYLKILSDNYLINSQDADTNGLLKLSRLTGYMQETAWHHAINLGFGPDFLHENGLGWVLSSIKLKIDYFPRWMEEITIETWPTGMERLFYLRDFLLYDSKGVVFGKAVSQWLMIDIEKKRPKVFQNSALDEVFDPNRRALDEGVGKLVMEKPDVTESRQVEYTDLDLNKHVNSNRYIDWMLNTFSTDFLNIHQLSDLQLHFKKEVLPDARLSISRERLNEQSYLFEGRSSDGKVVHFQAKTIFTNTKKHN